MCCSIAGHGDLEMSCLLLLLPLCHPLDPLAIKTEVQRSSGSYPESQRQGAKSAGYQLVSVDSGTPFKEGRGDVGDFYPLSMGDDLPHGMLSIYQVRLQDKATELSPST